MTSPDTEALVGTLSDNADNLRYTSPVLVREAADTISRLTADNEALRNGRDSTEKVASLIDEGLEILGNLADSIRRHGNYSPESTCMFIDQAGQAFREAHTVIAGDSNG